jgi:multiple sugar transport system substrate-binding protein
VSIIGVETVQHGKVVAVRTRVIASTLAATALAGAFTACGSSDSKGGGPVAINVWAGTQPGGSFQEAAKQCSADSGGRYRITFNALANNPDAQRQALVRRLAAKDKSIDIVGMDVVWTAEFAEAGWIKAFPRETADKIREGMLEGPIETATYEKQLFGAPGNSNTQLLWYRKDLVKGEPAKTWTGLIKQASELEEGGRLEIAGAAAENTTVWFNALVESGGGSVLSGPRTPRFDAAVQNAVKIIGQLATSKAADPSLAQQKEDQNRLAFQSGQAAFMVNWPFVYPSIKGAAEDGDAAAKKVFDNLGWLPYPRVAEDKESKGPIGGFNWGVSSYSAHEQEAFDAAACLASEKSQRTYLAKDALAPTISAIYDDPKTLEEFPFYGLIREGLEGGGPRPSTPAYSDVSLAIYSTLSPPRNAAKPGALEELRKNLKTALSADGVL